MDVKGKFVDMAHAPSAQTNGRLIHGARGYDLLVWLLMLGREGRFRARTLDFAGVRAGERVLDVGCGTGTLAIAAKQRVGATAMVAGVDASAEMIERARRKAEGVRVDVDFRIAAAEAMPWPDASFDVAICSMMLHHLPRETRERCLREVRRVLTPRGRLFIVEFSITEPRRGIIARLHKRGGLSIDGLQTMLADTGFAGVHTGEVGRNLVFLLTSPG